MAERNANQSLSQVGQEEYWDTFRRKCEKNDREMVEQKGDTINNRCSLHHGRRINIYCEQHDSLCCSVCVDIEHSQCCKSKSYIPTLAEGIKDGNKLQTVINDNDKLLSRFTTLEQGRTDLQAKLKASRKNCKRQTEETYGKLVKYVNELKNDSITDIDKKHDAIEQRIQEDIENCKNAKEELLKLKQQMDSTSASNEFLFIAMTNGRKAIVKNNDIAEFIVAKEIPTFEFIQDDTTHMAIYSVSKLGECTEVKSSTRDPGKESASQCTIRRGPTCDKVCSLITGVGRRSPSDMELRQSEECHKNEWKTNNPDRSTVKDYQWESSHRGNVDVWTRTQFGERSKAGMFTQKSRSTIIGADHDRGERDYFMPGTNKKEKETNKSGVFTNVDNPCNSNHKCKVVVGPNAKIGHKITADTYKINDITTIKIYDGLIDKVSKVDAVVSAADVSLKPTGFIAKALENAGGISYQNAVWQMQKDICPDKKEYGDVAVSKGGNLKVHKVLHLVSVRVSSKNDLSIFKTGMANVFTAADTNMFTSIALPLIGTGGLKDAKEGLLMIFCDAFVETMCEFYANNPQTTLKEIHLVNRSDLVCKTLNKAFGKVASSVGENDYDISCYRPRAVIR